MQKFIKFLPILSMLLIGFSFYTRYRTYILSEFIGVYTPEAFSGIGDLIFFSAWMILNTVIFIILLPVVIIYAKRRNELRNKQNRRAVLFMILALLVPFLLYALYYI